MVNQIQIALEEAGRRVRQLSLSLTKSFAEGGVQTAQIVTASTDAALSLGPLTTCLSLILYTDQTITININGADTDYTITGPGILVMHPTSITALTVDNASGSTANIVYGAYGNA